MWEIDQRLRDVRGLQHVTIIFAVTLSAVRTSKAHADSSVKAGIPLRAGGVARMLNLKARWSRMEMEAAYSLTCTTPASRVCSALHLARALREHTAIHIRFGSKSPSINSVLHANIFILLALETGDPQLHPQYY